MMDKILFSKFVFAGLLFVWTAGGPASAVITIEDNGYRGLVVAIHENITEDIRLLNNIKTMLTQASKYLHRVTRHRAYLEEVTIVVPSSWSPSADYLTGNENFRKAEVRVDAPNPSYGNEPYTLQPGECGDPGQYIHLTPEFLLGDGTGLLSDADGSSNDDKLNPNLNERSPSMFSPYGDLAPVFVHEFAHLRYGVFDEHGIQGDERTPLFYWDELGKIRPTGCPSGLRGVLGDTQGRSCRRRWDGLPDERCIFYPNLNTMTKGKDGIAMPSKRMSIMYMPGVELADGFCDDDSNNRRHNPIAPNKHNLMCQGRSTWDVVKSHVDFAGDKNPPRDIDDTTPKFRLIRPRDYRYQTVVLVLDLSGSMAGHRMKLLHSAVTSFIKYKLLAGLSSLAMVGFNTKARVIVDLTEVTEANRDKLVGLVPVKEDGDYTSIGSGIFEGLRVLLKLGDATKGAQMVLVSDGEENRIPLVEDTMADVRSAGVIVTTVALGKQASSKLEDLVRATGGNGYFYDDASSTSLTGLDTSFAAAVTVNAPVELQPVEITNRNMTLASNQVTESTFHVDSEVGKNTSFRLTYGSGDSKDLGVVLISPSGDIFNSSYPHYREDAVTRTIAFLLPEAEPGRWKYTVRSSLVADKQVTVVISSEAKDHSDQPIRIRSWISDIEFVHPARVKVYAEVKKGYAAILNASVTATVYRPDGTSHVMLLFDDGIGADTTEHDGIYSGYFAKFEGSGRYAVEANVLNDGRARLVLGIGTGAASTAPIVPVLPEGSDIDALGDPEFSFSADELMEELKTDGVKVDPRPLIPVQNFERFTTAGSFRLNDWQENVDLIPPRRVTDLRVIKTDLISRTVHLTWTAAGDNLDDDNANTTEVRFQLDQEFLLRFFNHSRLVIDDMLLNGSSLSPPPPKTPHLVIVALPSEYELFLNESDYRVFFALRTVDEAGNVAEVSNLAVAQFDIPVFRQRLPITDDDGWKNSMILGVLAALACVILVIGALALILRIRKVRRDQSMSPSRSDVCITNDQL